MVNSTARKTYSNTHTIKVYPDFKRLILYNQPKELKLDQFDNLDPLKNQTQELVTNSELDFMRSLRRSKTAIADYALCNQFELFVTFTFKKDRQNIHSCKTRFSQWLKDQRKAGYPLTYLAVPEFHKDGKSIHFHALISGYPTEKLKDSRKKVNGRKVYNLKNYRGGFTTACTIDNQQVVSSYIRKYITKDMPKLTDKKRYWISKNLLKPEIQFNPPYDLQDYEKAYENNKLTIYKSKLILPTTN